MSDDHFSPGELFERENDESKAQFSQLWGLLVARYPSLQSRRAKFSDSSRRPAIDRLLLDPASEAPYLLWEAHREITESKCVPWNLFLSSDALTKIQEEDRTCGDAARWYTGIEDIPVVYIFASLGSGEFVKVGESENARRRIGRDHLRGDHSASESNIVAFYRKRGEWPSALADMVCLMLPVLGCDPGGERRRAIESFLTSKLDPLMARPRVR